MVENEKYIKLYGKVPTFTPIDERLDSERPYKITIASVEGPNGVGKTSVWRQAINVLQSVYTLINPEGKPVPSVKGVIEPPAWFMGDGRQDTWRSLAKEGKSKDGVLDETQLKDPFFQAGLFLWARRLVERGATFNYQHLTAPFYYEPDTVLFKPGQYVGFREDMLRTAGSAILVKDRGTGSTLRYQGRDSEKGHEVRNLIYGLYKQGFLRREDMTILVMPYGDTDIREGEGRNQKESDQYSEEGDIASYRSIRKHEGMFTKRIVEINNDPTGARNCISTTACFTAMLVFAAEQEKRGLLKIKKGEVMELGFPLRMALDRLNDVGTPGMERASQLVMNDLSSTQYHGGWYKSGDVKIKLVNNGVQMIIEPRLSEKVKQM